jgi:hypothetical protein
MKNQIRGVPAQVAHRGASEAVGGRATYLVDNDVGTAPSRFEVGPNGDGPCRIRCHTPTRADTAVRCGQVLI